MSRISFSLSAAWLLGAMLTAACSSNSGSDSKGSGSVSSGSAASSAEPPGSAQGGGTSDPNAGGGLLDFGNSVGGTGDASSAGGGASTDGIGGSSSTDGDGGATDGVPATGGVGTTDPPLTATGGVDGTTTDPPPEATGGTGVTTDPPPDETEDPPPDETEDPPPDETEDPPPDETEDPPPDETEDPPPDETEDPPPDETEDPPPVDECIPTEMTDVNVIVFEDAEPSGADSEGRMYVGGNAVFDGYAIASKEEVDCATWGLVVGGDLNVSGGSVNTGKIAVGGTYTSGGGFTAGCGVWEGEEPVDFDALEARMIAYSEAMAAYPENGESTVSNDTLYLTGGDLELNVFTVTAAELNSNVILDVPDGSSVIVNVSGTDVVWSGRGFELPDGGAACRGDTSDWCHSIMYNLYEATSIELSGIGVQGSILAPYATFNGSGGNVDGQVVVKYLYGGIEFHPYFFSGCLLLPEVEEAT